jgi:ADP-ribose pyrophosphatase YjhB (NUDIX family)
MLDTLLIRLFLQPYWRLTRGQTLGVQGIVVDDSGRVLLVRHSYVRGWHLPGGGVERDESLETALIRELREESAIVLDGKPSLLGVFSNFKRSPGDHIGVFLVRKWHRLQEPRWNLEIIEQKFFDLHSLPAGIIDGARRRLEEALLERPVRDEW